jgi:hypothetical protein
MAKYGVTNIAGGGGIGSDEVSVTKEYVLNGKTYVGSDSNDEIGTGTMANNGATGNQSLNAGGSFSVKKGYHAQDFTVNANNLASQTQGTATASHILNGQTAWVNGSRITGNIASIGGQTISPGNSQQTISSSGKYMTGNIIVNAVSNLSAENIKKGVTIGNVTGTWEGYIAGSLDLYNRGAWGSISSSNLSPTWFVSDNYLPGKLRYDSAQIALTPSSNRYSMSMLITKSFNTINYSQFNVTMLNGQSTNTQFLKIECGIGYENNNGKWQIVTRLGSLETSIGSSEEKTISLNLTNVNSTVFFLLSMYPNTTISSLSDFAYIKRIWFSS